MNGLTLLGVLLTFGLMGWAAWALVHEGTRKDWPTREMYRDRWDNR